MRRGGQGHATTVAARVRCVAFAVCVSLAAGPLSADASPGGAHGDVFCKAHAARRGGVLLLHPGSFVIGATAGYLRARCRPWVRAGFDVIGVDYPVRDFRGAVRASRKAARLLRRREPRGRVFAYGESAGGTLAALLDVTGAVDGAVLVSAPTDLLTWASDDTDYWENAMHMSLRERRWGSPVFRITDPSPALLLYSRRDRVVPFGQGAALARRVRTARLERLRGGHLRDRTVVPRAIRWLVRHRP